MRTLHRELLLVGAPLLMLWMLFGVGKAWYLRVGENQQHTCQAYLHQMGLAMLQYSQDYDGLLPPASRAVKASTYNWIDDWRTYDYGPKDFICPADSAPFDLRGSQFRRGSFSITATSYVWNDAYRASNDGLTPPSGQPRSRIAMPEQTVLIADGARDFLFQWELIDGAVLPPEEARFRLGSIVGRHNGRPNVLFCDDHVAALPVEEVFLPRRRGKKPYFAGLSIEDD